VVGSNAITAMFGETLVESLGDTREQASGSNACKEGVDDDASALRLLHELLCQRGVPNQGIGVVLRATRS
jgi:hypothetical protein